MFQNMQLSRWKYMQNAAKKQVNVFECKSQRHEVRRNLRLIKLFIYCCHILHSDQGLELAADLNMYISSIATDAEKNGRLLVPVQKGDTELYSTRNHKGVIISS